VVPAQTRRCRTERRDRPPIAQQIPLGMTMTRRQVIAAALDAQPAIRSLG
jgi:hypothetical protein